MEKTTILGVLNGDITKISADVIVNSANSSLFPGTGLDALIHEKAGESLLEECLSLNGCAVGSAKITKGYNLPVRHIIHAVGPKRTTNDRAVLLEGCYREILRLAKSLHAKELTIPAISTGVYGYPKREAAEIAVKTIMEFCEQNDCFSKITIVVSDETNLKIYKSLIH